MKSLKTIFAATGFAATAACFNGCTCEDDGVDLSPNAVRAAEAVGWKASEHGGGVLHIYTWSDYFAPEVFAGFEKGLGVKVVVDTFDSNEAMYAKLKAGGGGYDIITPSSYQIGVMAREKMIDKLDQTKLAGVKANFDKSFEKQVLDPGFTYSVPYAVTYTGFAYLKNKIPAGATPATWAILGNPVMKGRISLLDDIREVVGAGLMYLGYSINSTNSDEIAAAADQVLKWRSNIRKFDSESYKNEVASGATWLGHGYSTDVTQVIVGDEEAGAPARDDIGFALPKEGFSISFDEMVLSATSKQKLLAYAFINYIYDGEVAKVNMEYICGPNPVKPGIDLLDEEYRSLIILDPVVLKRGQLLKGFDDKPGVQELYNKAWDRIKATEAKLK